MYGTCRLVWQRRMEPLWSPMVPIGGKPWQMPQARTGQKQAKTVAVGYDQLPRRAHGKEGSPVRVRKRALKTTWKISYSLARSFCSLATLLGMEHFLEYPDSARSELRRRSVSGGRVGERVDPR